MLHHEIDKENFVWKRVTSKQSSKMSWLNPDKIVNVLQTADNDNLYFWLRYKNFATEYLCTKSIETLYEYLDNDWEADFIPYCQNMRRGQANGLEFLSLGIYQIGFPRVEQLDEFERYLSMKVDKLHNALCS